MNIDQSAMCYISIDSSRQSLQTNDFFFKFEKKIYFRIRPKIKTFKRIVRRLLDQNRTIFLVTGHLPECPLPDGHLPDSHLPERSFAREVICPTVICSRGHLPE